MELLPQSSISGIHPIVGHAYTSSNASFLHPGESLIDGLIRIRLGCPSGPRVLITGGSTSDIYYDGSWVRPFSRHIFYQASDIYSCACVGYSTSQELARLLECIDLLRPHYVLSLSGINDFGLLQSHNRRCPYIHPYQFRLYAALSSSTNTPSLDANAETSQIGDRSIVALAHNLGNDGYHSWHTNITLMHELCNINHSQFFAFLQPCLGYPPNDPVKNSIEGFYLHALAEKQPWYLSAMKSFYDKATEFCKSSPFAFDLTSCLGSKVDNLFADTRHLNVLGNCILAEQIYAIIGVL